MTFVMVPRPPLPLLQGMWRRLLIALAVFVATFTLFLFWYQDRFSMDRVVEVDVPVEEPVAEVLIATQGSAYKNAVTDGLATQLRGAQVHVRIIDVGQLAGAVEGVPVGHQRLACS